MRGELDSRSKRRSGIGEPNTAARPLKASSDKGSHNKEEKEEEDDVSESEDDEDEEEGNRGEGTKDGGDGSGKRREERMVKLVKSCKDDCEAETRVTDKCGGLEEGLDKSTTERGVSRQGGKMGSGNEACEDGVETERLDELLDESELGPYSDLREGGGFLLSCCDSTCVSSSLGKRSQNSLLNRVFGSTFQHAMALAKIFA